MVMAFEKVLARVIGFGPFTCAVEVDLGVTARRDNPTHDSASRSAASHGIERTWVIG